MTRQDEKLRLRRRLQSEAIHYATENRWQEALEANLNLLSLGEEAETLNRVGKAYLELGRYDDARQTYERTLEVMPNNPIARRNLERLQDLANHPLETGAPQLAPVGQIADLRIFITETGKTTITTLVDVPGELVLGTVGIAQQVMLVLEERMIAVRTLDGMLIGYIEPKLAQRLSELLIGGNRYTAAVAQLTSHQIRVIIREIYQNPAQRGRVSFPGRLNSNSMRSSYIANTPFEEYGDDLEEEDISEEREEVEEETFGSDEEEVGFEDIEPDIADDDEAAEE